MLHGKHFGELAAMLGLLMIFMSSSALADENIDGFGDFRIGMTMEKAKLITSLAEENPSLDLYRTEEYVWFADLEFNIMLTFNKDKIAYVTLQYVNWERPFDCQKSHVYAYGAAKAKYGAPDIPLVSFRTEDIFVIQSGSGQNVSYGAQALFWQRDGSHVELSSWFSGSIYESEEAKCLVELVFFDTLEGHD